MTGSNPEQTVLENLETIASRHPWAERLARIKTAELMRGHAITVEWNEEAPVKKERP